jgi:hypothetical protein
MYWVARMQSGRNSVTWKVLASDSELDAYRHAIQQKIDVLLPLEYLKRSRVVACFDEFDEIAGGFVLVLKPPFRVIDSIPDGAGMPLGVSPDSVAELTGLWMSRRYAQRHGSVGLWVRMFREVLTCSKTNFVYAYSLRKPKLADLYAGGRPVVLYRGETKTLPGMDGPDLESVEMVSLRGLMMGALATPTFFLKRLKPSRESRLRKLIPLWLGRSSQT